MNHLGHLYLSPNNDDIILGTILGDFVKGPIKTYDSYFNRSIMLHRKLDSFTDNNLEVKKSALLINPSYRRYSGIIIDVFYDHFLSNNWALFHRTPLENFTEKIYNLINDRLSELPHAFQLVAPKMIKNDWLLLCKKKQNLERVLVALGKRFKKEVDFSHSTKDLDRNYHKLEEHFFAFMPMAKSFCNEYYIKNF